MRLSNGCECGRENLSGEKKVDNEDILENLSRAIAEYDLAISLILGKILKYNFPSVKVSKLAALVRAWTSKSFKHDN
jgi:hypothetical protein